MLKTLKIILNLFLFALLLYVLLSQSNNFARLIYPYPYKDLIVHEADKYGLDPLLIVSIIRVESGFKEGATSDKGARGLMQIMPDTGFWIAEQIGLDDFSKDKIYEPNINVLLGTWYLNDLLQQFDTGLYPALAAYNGGRGHVKKWLDSGIWDGGKETLDDIPFAETRSFVGKVICTYGRYQRIYGGEKSER
ncbi:MAG TPA: lytic transglycosylase domain-containing protein [Firmicutes bacterium]|nr:lytic transglycosylase domain-containing protein [Bacillota bacterium]